MIELRNIETFFWVATLGSFRAASEKLNTTQPAVSQRIASLEADLGVRLFERDARGVKLTGKGHELLSHAERMLQVRRDMFEAAREQNVMTGTVRIGVAETIVQTWLPTLIELIHTTYPAFASADDRYDAWSSEYADSQQPPWMNTTVARFAPAASAGSHRSPNWSESGP